MFGSQAGVYNKREKPDMDDRIGMKGVKARVDQINHRGRCEEF